MQVHHQQGEGKKCCHGVEAQTASALLVSAAAMQQATVSMPTSVCGHFETQQHRAFLPVEKQQISHQSIVAADFVPSHSWCIESFAHSSQIILQITSHSVEQIFDRLWHELKTRTSRCGKFE